MKKLPDTSFVGGAHRRNMKKLPDTSFVGGAHPTHSCIICGAFWRKYENSWNLRSKECGECCDNAPMGEQIQPLPDSAS